MRRLGVVVLAAGRGERFGGPKQIAVVDGRPLLAHVLAAVAAARPSLAAVVDEVVVLGFRADEVEQAVTASVPVGRHRFVRNPDPGRGIASSLATGLSALAPDVEGALIILGDQPRLRPAVIEAVADAWASSGARVVVPRYSRGGGRNPVLLDRQAWPLATGLSGDHGMGRLLAADPTLALVVDVAGANPDVDTPDDLAAL